MDFEKMITPSS